MQTYEILVQNRAVKGNSKDMTLVRTSVGIDQVHVLFDSAEWLDFPVTITFAQGDDIVTQSLLLTSLTDSDWVAEATVTIPYEVIDMTGAIRVTLQGTDAQGRHIITAKGSPLSVEESGDVVIGELPANVPTVDQWQQAYSQAMAAASAAQSLVDNIQNQIESMIANAEERIISSFVLPIATTESSGTVIIGDNISVDEGGRISVANQSSSSGGMTSEQAAALINLSNLAYYAFDTEFNTNGVLLDNVMVKRTALPLAGITIPGIVKVDGSTVVISSDGTISSISMIPDGTSITVDETNIASVPTARVGKLGLVSPDGTTITIENGVLTATGAGGEGGYILPKASDSQLGGIKVGNGLAIDSDGVLSVNLVVADELEF